MPFAEGETIGSYRIIEQLGQGGMATVYKAYHPSLDRYVAIKALHPAFQEDPNFLARFQREARVVAKLEHPNIAPIFDFAEHEGRPYLVIKYIEGETLKARMSRGPLSVDEILKVIEAVGAGLFHAHKQGILHRDVKPSNVLLSNEGGIFLADFGLARIAQAGESTISSDMLLGTPQYISPEQAVGKRELDEGTDIYSFGVLIYEMLVGKVPFNADTPYAIIHDHIYTPLPLPRQENPAVSAAAERQLLRALAKERSDRFSDIETMVAEFKRALQEEPLTVPILAGLQPVRPQAVAESPVSVPVTPAEPARDDLEAFASQPEATRLSALTPPPADFPSRMKMLRKKKKWLWVVLPSLLFLCVCLVLTAEELAKDQRFPFANGVNLQLEGTDPTNILDLVDQDPNVHVDLALDYFEEDLHAEALDELQNAVDLAGNDIGFYRNATNGLIEEGEYIPAAWLYLHALGVLQPDRPADLVNGARMAVYLSYNDERAPQYLPYEMIEKFDPVLRQVVEARLVYFSNSQPLRAQTLLAQILKDNPRNPEARLLEAEIQLEQGRLEAAYLILQDLVDSADTPSWILDIANEYLPQ